MILTAKQTAANYFKASYTHPFHLSVGAVVLDEQNHVYCHHFQYADFVILMRETVQPLESIEDTLSRGLLDEFGARTELVTFLGTLTNVYPIDNVPIEKTTVYFLCRLVAQNNAWRKYNDEESDSVVVSHTIEHLIDKMVEQSARLNLPTLDESAILLRAKDYLEQGNA